MGKGRLLTMDEIEELKVSDKKFILLKRGEEIIVTLNENGYTSDGYGWEASQRCIGLINGELKIYEYIEEPKTYKTSEMIAMLEENKELKFKSAYENPPYKVYADCKNIILEDSAGSITNGFCTTDTWTLIEEPKEVTFMEAVQAKKDYKTVKCVLDGDEMIYKGDTSWFADDRGRAVSYNEILNGKWFVEESND